MTDEQYMDMALAEGEAALVRGDWPVGAVLVKDGKVISSGANRQVTETDVSWHAEMEVIRKAFKALGTTDLTGTVIYCTMECCPMCAWAVKIANVKRIVLGLRHADIGRTDMGTYSMETFAALVGGGVELQTGVRNAECLALRRRWGRDPVRK